MNEMHVEPGGGRSVPRPEVAAVVFAAGKGTRMTGYTGNKTLLPLLPSRSLYEGERPLLVEVLRNLPAGRKGVVVNHRAEDVARATRELGVSCIPQPEADGTGGALLASRSFLESASEDSVLITMGDVPLIRPATYERLTTGLASNVLVVLAFTPRDKAQYGRIEMEEGRVRRIVEWKYWRSYPPERQASLLYCNAGVYAARRIELLQYLDRLAEMPHRVEKEREGQRVTILEYFLTDLVELMSDDGLPIGVVPAPEEEVMGVDTPEALKQAQMLFKP